MYNSIRELNEGQDELKRLLVGRFVASMAPSRIDFSDLRHEPGFKEAVQSVLLDSLKDGYSYRNSDVRSAVKEIVTRCTVKASSSTYSDSNISC